MIVVRVLAGVAGTVVVVATLLSAMRTVVVPRAVPVRLTGLVFGGTRRLFDAAARRHDRYEDRDHVMALYAPSSLLLLPLAWLTSVWLGYGLLFHAVEATGVWASLDASGSSLLTLGFTRPETIPGTLLAFSEASLGVAILALLLVTYLPSMYAAFSRRERQVTLLEVRAGSPPSGVEFLTRYARIRGLGELEPVWRAWEEWFADIQESHTSLPALVFFRSPEPGLSWVTAAGALLDAASPFVACVDHPAVLDDHEIRQPSAETCIRSGYLSLRAIGRYFDVPFHPDPAPDDPIAVTREDFDTAWAVMRDAGVPLRADADEAWRAFAGWRVNYDGVLLELAELVMAPTAPWTSDRGRVDLGPPSRHRSRRAARGRQ